MLMMLFFFFGQKIVHSHNTGILTLLSIKIALWHLEDLEFRF